MICRNLRLLIAVAGLILMGATRPLWFGDADIFPRVPLVSWVLGWPGWCDRFAGGLMVFSLVALIRFPNGGSITRLASLSFAGGLLAAVLLDHQRLQPWAYEFCLLLLVMTWLPAPKAVPCLRLVVASIYLHSGLSKLDASFLMMHGAAFVSVVTDAVGWDFSSAPLGVRRAVVALLPLGEIAVAVGFCVPKTRRVAMWCSVGMHGMLLGILGPWGLGHKPGVLIWNLFFIGQNLLLFRSGGPAVSHEPTEPALPKPKIGWQVFGGYVFVGLVVALPFLEPFGYYDHWPAWAVYASRPERPRLYVAENRVQDLAVEIQKFVSDEDPPADSLERFLAGKPAWKRLKIDRWSLDVLNAPLYPQDRFQIGVALAVADEHDLGEDLRVEIDSPADRFTGERSTKILEGAAAVQKYAKRYRLNALPRK